MVVATAIYGRRRVLQTLSLEAALELACVFTAWSSTLQDSSHQHICGHAIGHRYVQVVQSVTASTTSNHAHHARMSLQEAAALRVCF